MKRLEFLGDSLSQLQAFPAEVRRAAGFELWQVQNGLMPSDFRPMPSVGAGVYEIRIHRRGAWRVIYVARLEDRVWVLHAFAKKTRATAAADIALARRRYRQMEQ